ncbi:hypothetical protein ACP0HM_01820 [Escherichia coli]
MVCREAARRYGVDLKVLEAGGYSQLATQQAQIDQCKTVGAQRPFCSVVARPHFPTCKSR